jgi:hypothetical protein
MVRKEAPMEEPEDSSGITPEVLAEMQAAIERAMRGIRDHEAMRRAGG